MEPDDNAQAPFAECHRSPVSAQLVALELIRSHTWKPSIQDPDRTVILEIAFDPPDASPLWSNTPAGSAESPPPNGPITTRGFSGSRSDAGGGDGDGDGDGGARHGGLTGRVRRTPLFQIGEQTAS